MKEDSSDAVSLWLHLNPLKNLLFASYAQQACSQSGKTASYEQQKREESWDDAHTIRLLKRELQVVKGHHV